MNDSISILEQLVTAIEQAGVNVALPIRAGFDPLRLSYCAYLQDVASNSACAFSMLIGVNKS